MNNLDPNVNTNELLNRHLAEKTHKQLTQQQNNTQHIKNKTKKKITSKTGTAPKSKDEVPRVIYVSKHVVVVYVFRQNERGTCFP